jgi:hypothetical protein
VPGDRLRRRFRDDERVLPPARPWQKRSHDAQCCIVMQAWKMKGWRSASVTRRRNATRCDSLPRSWLLSPIRRVVPQLAARPRPLGMFDSSYSGFGSVLGLGARAANGRLRVPRPEPSLTRSSAAILAFFIYRSSTVPPKPSTNERHRNFARANCSGQCNGH